MSKGFKVVCEGCNNEVILNSNVDSYMGYDGHDIYSNNSALIYFINDKDVAGIQCKCGNSIIDK